LSWCYLKGKKVNYKTNKLILIIPGIKCDINYPYINNLVFKILTDFSNLEF
jgi:hypothetical protein